MVRLQSQDWGRSRPTLVPRTDRPRRRKRRSRMTRSRRRRRRRRRKRRRTETEVGGRWEKAPAVHNHHFEPKLHRLLLQNEDNIMRVVMMQIQATAVTSWGLASRCSRDAPAMFCIQNAAGYSLLVQHPTSNMVIILSGFPVIRLH